MSCSTLIGDIEESVSLESLPREVAWKIFSFLENKDLLTLREVSKTIKEHADYKLKTRKNELVVDQKNERKLQGLCEVYRDIRDLKFNCTTSRFEDLISVCNGRLTKLISFSVLASYCNQDNIHLISDIFANIQQLSLTWVAVNDHALGALFSSLPQLRTVQIDTVPISGSCFAFLGKHVESIVFDSDFQEMDGCSLFTCDRSALKVLNLIVDGIAKMDTFFEMLSKEAPNIESFGVKLRCNLCCLDKLFLPNLVSLTLIVYGIDGELDNLKPMKNVEEICLDIAGVSDKTLGRILTNFPSVDWLQLHLTRNQDMKCSTQFINDLRSLRSLEYIGLHDLDYKQSKYDWNGFDDNAVIEVIRCSPKITEVDFHVSAIQKEESFEKLIYAAKSVITQRTNLWFEMFVNGTEVHLN